MISADETEQLRAIRVVAPADPEGRRFLIEIDVGVEEGLPFNGVVRAALPQKGRILCNWLISLSPSDLLERAGAVAPEKLVRIKSMLKQCGL